MIPRILPIYTYPHPSLRVKTEPVLELTDEIRQLIVNMRATMINAKGLGLSANQVGSTWNICVVNSTNAQGEQGMVLINPEILETDGIRWFMDEGCLSIPKLQVEIARDLNIRVSYRDMNWDVQELETDSSENKSDKYLARIILHEVEHLTGGLIVDHLKEPTDDQQRLLKRIELGHMSVKYPTIR